MEFYKTHIKKKRKRTYNRNIYLMQPCVVQPDTVRFHIYSPIRQSLACLQSNCLQDTYRQTLYGGAIISEFNLLIVSSFLIYGIRYMRYRCRNKSLHQCCIIPYSGTVARHIICFFYFQWTAANVVVPNISQGSRHTTRLSENPCNHTLLLVALRE